MKLMMMLSLTIFTFSVVPQEITQTINHDIKVSSIELFSETSIQTEVILSSAAIKDPENLITGFDEIGEYKYLIDIENIDRTKKAYIDNLDILFKDRLYVVKNNISNNVVFTNGKLIAYFDNVISIDISIDELISIYSNELILDSKYSGYAIFKVNDISKINELIELLEKDTRILGVELDIIDPNINPR